MPEEEKLKGRKIIESLNDGKKILSYGYLKGTELVRQVWRTDFCTVV